MTLLSNYLLTHQYVYTLTRCDSDSDAVELHPSVMYDWRRLHSAARYWLRGSGAWRLWRLRRWGFESAGVVDTDALTVIEDGAERSAARLVQVLRAYESGAGFGLSARDLSIFNRFIGLPYEPRDYAFVQGDYNARTDAVALFTPRDLRVFLRDWFRAEMPSRGIRLYYRGVLLVRLSISEPFAVIYQNDLRLQDAAEWIRFMRDLIDAQYLRFNHPLQRYTSYMEDKD